MIRKIDTNAFIANQSVPTKIPSIKYGRDLLLYLSGSLTTGSTPTVLEDAPLSLVSAIDLVGSAGDPSKNGSLHRLSGMDLYVLNAFETGSFGYIRRHGTTGTTLYPFVAMMVLPFTTFPQENLNLFPHPVFTNLQLDVTWATIAALGADIGATFTVMPKIDIYEVTREPPPLGAVLPSMMRTVTKSVPAMVASDNNDVDIMTGLAIQQALIRINDNSIRSDAFCTSVGLIENDSLYHLSAIPWAVLQAYNRYRSFGMGGVGFHYPFVESADNNTATAVGLGLTNRSTIKGYAYLNFIDNEGAPLLNTEPKGSLKLRLTTGASAGGTPSAVVILRQKVG
jgi:hypothetical protein